MEDLLWILLILPVLWVVLAASQAAGETDSFAEAVARLTELLQRPAELCWTEHSLKAIIAVLVLYPMSVIYYKLDNANRHPGAEYGTARWGSIYELNQAYRNTKDAEQNLILTQNVRMGTDVYRHRHNLNVMVIGGSGSGKTRYYVKPNLMQCACSYIILDPKGEILRDIGNLFEQRGIPVTVIDLVHFVGHYNPMEYLETEEDAIKLAYALVNNTKPKDAKGGGDKFWDDSSVMLISAILLYLMYEAPKEEQNFATLMYMIMNCQISEDSRGPNPLELLFQELEEIDPEHPALLMFHSFQLGGAKTLQSVLISAAANLYMFNTRRFAEMTSRDECFLPRLGLEKRAIFCVIPDNNETYNFLITILYTQIFDQLFRLADSDTSYRGTLPVHVRLMMDEFANVALPSNFKNILSVCRSRNISCDIILQSYSQLKALFKDDCDGIMGNCDTFLYLGNNEQATHEMISKMLGKETEHTKNQTIGKGSHGSSSDSIQSAGRELMTPDEVRKMKNSDALLFLRSEYAVIDKKYNLKKHPNVRLTPDGGGQPFILPHDYMGEVPTISPAALFDAEPEKVPRETLDRYEIIDLED